MFCAIVHLSFYFLLLRFGNCLLCKDILEAPENKKWGVDELRTAPPKEIIECLAHLGKESLLTDEALFIWETLVKYYDGVANVPEEQLALLHWITVAIEPEDYANITLSSIYVIENFGLDYKLSQLQLSAIAERVREDWGGKEPEDYTYYDLVALKQILCAFNKTEIEKIHPQAYKEAAVSLEVKMTTTRILMTVNQAWSAEKSDKCEENSTKPPPSTLSSTVVSVAARELRETASTKEQALSHLRSWLAQNGDVRNVRLDESFLLRFLRQKKFSVPMAQQTLLKYLNLRKYYPEICKALDCQDPKLKELIEDGYIVISPVRDSHGRRVIVYDMGKFNASKFGCWEMARAHYLIYESLLEEQEDQVLGFTHVGDGGGASGSHVTCWNPIDFARLMKWGEQSIPMRHKEIHLVNVPATVKYVLDFACSKVSPKIVGRLYIHSNLRMLHKKVDVSCLPTIYGGNVPLEDMIAHTKQILMKHRPKVLGLDFMEIISTRGIQSARSKPGCKTNDTTSIQGSFRKLEID